MSESAAVPIEQARVAASGRWWQLTLGVICMSMIANLQYGWTLFVNPIQEKYQWGLPAIQVAFTIFIIVETWLVPLEGYAVDRWGPKLVGAGSGVLVAVAWIINAYANTLALLYLGAIVGGIGAGGVYGACVGNALKWFPDRRGMATGLAIMGFGGGAMIGTPLADLLMRRFATPQSVGLSAAPGEPNRPRSSAMSSHMAKSGSRLRSAAGRRS